MPDISDMAINPDCAMGKHAPCAGDAWDERADEPTSCKCGCHNAACNI